MIIITCLYQICLSKVSLVGSFKHLPDSHGTQITAYFCMQLASKYVMPALWKIGEIVPVQKKPLPKVDNDLRPVTLTVILAKCFERALLPKITTHTQPVMDKMQFAYQANRSTDYAIITLIHEIAQQLDVDSTYARSLFIDYSSAFNTMQPHIIISRLAEYNISARLQLLVLDFLTNRQQYVRTECEISSTITVNTGAPQGCVLSAFLFIVYTNALSLSSENCKIIKYAMDHVSEESADLHLTSTSSEHCRAPSPSPASRSPPSQHSPPSPSQQTDNMQEKKQSLVQSADDSAKFLTDQSLSHPTQQPDNKPSAISLPANPPTTQSSSPAPAKPASSSSPAAALARSRHNQRNPAMVRSFSTPRRSPSIPSTPKSTPMTPASGQQDIRVVMKRKEPSSSPDYEDSVQGKVLKSDDSIS